MFRKLKAGVMNMAKSIMNAKREERESKIAARRENYELVKTIVKDIVNGVDYVLNGDGNKKLRKVAVVMAGATLTIAVLSYMK